MDRCTALWRPQSGLAMPQGRFATSDIAHSNVSRGLASGFPRTYTGVHVAGLRAHPRMLGQCNASDPSRLAFSNSPHCENSQMITSISSVGAKLAAGWASMPTLPDLNFQTNSRTIFQTISLTFSLTISLTISLTFLSICAKASRARRNRRQANQMRLARIPGTGGPVLKSLVPSAEKFGFGRPKVWIRVWVVPLLSMRTSSPKRRKAGQRQGLVSPPHARLLQSTAQRKYAEIIASRKRADHMNAWFRNVKLATLTIAHGMFITLWYMLQTFRRQTFTQHYEYPEKPVPVKPRYRRFHRFDLTTCIGCDKCARACPVDCIYIDKEKATPPLKGFKVTGFKIDYTKCMFCALCVDPCPVDCIFMGSTYDQSCFSRDGCIVDFAKLPVEVAWGQATLNPTAIAASKLTAEPVWTKPPDPPPPPKPAAAAPPAPAPTAGS